MRQIVKTVLSFLERSTMRKYLERQYGLATRDRWYHWLKALIPLKLAVIADARERRSM